MLRACWNALLILIIAVPVLVIEEDWHGHPMIDQSGYLWLAPAIIVSVVFVLGGYFANRSALASGVIAALALDGAAVLRRFVIVREHLPPIVLVLWVSGTTVSIALSCIGGYLRRFTTKSR